MIYKRILLPTDGSENNKVAIEHAIALAKELDADVTALSVVDRSLLASFYNSISFPNLLAQLQEMSRKAVYDAVTEGEKKGVRISANILDGQAADEIIKESKNYDLIVMGSLGRTGLSHLLIGSVAEKVVRLADCPVLVVRRPQNG